MGNPNDPTLSSYHYSIYYFTSPNTKPFNCHLQLPMSTFRTPLARLLPSRSSGVSGRLAYAQVVALSTWRKRKFPVFSPAGSSGATPSFHVALMLECKQLTQTPVCPWSLKTRRRVMVGNLEFRPLDTQTKCKH